MTRELPRTARASLYRLCADLLTQELDAERLEALRVVSGPLERLEPGLGPWLEAADMNALAQLRTEFARLFLLPKGVSCQASAWLEDGSQAPVAPVATLVHRAMEALEIEQTKVAGSLPLDHLGLVLAVASEALASEVPERRRIGVQLEEQALGGWAWSFAEELAKRAESPLYRALGQLIRELFA